MAFYGTQSIDMTPATSAFLGHYAATDPYVDDDERTLLEADLHVLDKDVEFHHYPAPGTGSSSPTATPTTSRPPRWRGTARSRSSTTAWGSGAGT